MQGYLESLSIHVQRYRKSMHRVVPLGSFLHRRQPITRRYTVCQALTRYGMLMAIIASFAGNS